MPFQCSKNAENKKNHPIEEYKDESGIIKINTDRLSYRFFFEKEDEIKNLLTLNKLNANKSISLLINMNSIVNETIYIFKE